MKVRKKVLALLLAAVTTLSVGVTAFATEGSGNDYTDQDTVTIKKEYEATNAGTKSPAETFYLKQDGAGRVREGEATTAPDLIKIQDTEYVGQADFSAGGAKTDSEVDGGATRTVSMKINLPEYSRVGIYEYTLKEVDNGTVGVDYFDGDIILVVTVIRNSNGEVRVAGVHTETPVDTGNATGKKSDTFVNSYSAGQLSVTKKVTGNMGDQEKYFKFTVTLNAPATGSVKSEITVGETPYVGPDGKKNPTTIILGVPTDFYLKHDDTLLISNIPYGVTYKVVEEADSNYDAPEYTFSSQEKGDEKLVDTAEETVVVTNNRDEEVDTGITLDTLPYILVSGLVMIAAVVMIVRRRRVED